MIRRRHGYRVLAIALTLLAASWPALGRAEALLPDDGDAEVARWSLEFFARFSNFDAADDGQGTDTDVLTVGANYYRSANFRLILNYLRASVDGPGSDSLVGGHPRDEALVARLEVSF